MRLTGFVVLLTSAVIAAEFRPASERPAGESGLRFRYYEAPVDTTLDLTLLKPDREGAIAQFAFPPGIRRDNFGLELWGAVDVPRDGTYTFFTDSDDGSRLYIGDRLVVANDYAHGPTEKSGTVSLATGRHPIYVAYFELTVGEVLKVSWEGPGIQKSEIPTTVLSQHPKSEVVPKDALTTTVLSWQDHAYDLRVEVDTRDAPDMAAFHESLPKLLHEHYPTIVELVGDDGRDLPTSVRFSFRPGIKVPAYASRGIVMSSDWFAKHPRDLGCAIHELTHVVQRYPGFLGKPGWLVEGIADYVRHRVGLDEGWRIPSGYREGHHYTKGYGIAAAFLVFAEKKVGPELVPKLNQSLRDKSYKPEIWKALTGKDLDALWEEYKQEGD